ncbi:hypothetical protein MPTK1_1g20650 [Marchantia polymorpha subsp. ruderalis]|uniref:Uncharacterized protein n=2 Tax=Marchantia polymorpha TaxID=3197 RepID=A0AAF6ASC9_MARPO|nr:hypothetical protein MARPO_0001s0401 [Marchantia polymorpha]BBM99349.1 hypothetical protein Mp_1g20650 [Marchantia polymorpha subsp. ruderalis]|eukprot:PTQ50431.1 hypothetical protein MARPO_0001s0401 [Marchantia polymorpha]
MCDIIRTQALLNTSCSMWVCGGLQSGGACSHGFRSPSLAFRMTSSSTSSRGPSGHSWTTSGSRVRNGSRFRHLVRASVLGPELSYELADQINAWIIPAPPEPVQFPRKTLNLKFAVLLMRSAYEAVDDLDFIPMNKFQVKFWKLRQSELEPYTLQYKPLRVKYGDLTDPLYFDFISFAQFATISKEIQTGEVVFQEKLGASGELQTVRRDASLVDNAKLPTAFIERAGNIIYERLLEGFEDDSFNAPPPLSEDSSFSVVVQNVQKLLQILVDQGYALKAVVDEVESFTDSRGGKFRVKVDGSATLWGLQTLVSRRALVLSNFDALAVGGFLRACKRHATYKIRCSDTSVEELWTVT